MSIEAPVNQIPADHVTRYLDYAIPIDDVHTLAYSIMSTYSLDPTYEKVAWLLLACISRDGHAEATISLLSRWLRQDRWARRSPGRAGRTRKLESSEAKAAIQRLRDFAEQGNPRALALEGQLAKETGDLPLAVTRFRAALPGAVANARKKRDPKLTPLMHLRQLHDELSSPWIELADLCVNFQRDTKVAEEAFSIGVELDDPNTYYFRASFTRATEVEKAAAEHGQGLHIEHYYSVTPYSMEWLHDMTKAASAGHIMATIEMAHYYADSLAEPPPSPPSQQNWFKAILSFGRAAFNAMTTRSVINANAKPNMTYYASLLQDPYERMTMARQWLSVAANCNYAPASLLQAHIHLSKYIYPGSNLNLQLVHTDRQTPSDHLDAYHPFEHITQPLALGVENPAYNPAEAHSWLLAVFKMSEAFANANANADGTESVRAFHDLVGIWYLFPEVADLYEQQIPTLVDQAEQMADTFGIDITDPDGRLMYRHQGERGKGVFEIEEDGTRKQSAFVLERKDSWQDTIEKLGRDVLSEHYR